MQEDREPEIWKPIPGYEGIYEISSWGRVKSLERIVKGAWCNPNQKVKEKLLTLSISFGYNRAVLKRNGKGKHFRVCRLVSSVFLDNYNDCVVVNHLDEDKLNDYYKNLENVSIRENTTYYFKNNFSKTSKYIGVSYDKSKPKRPWVASFYHNEKTVKLGNFESEEEAHKVYLEGLDFYGLTNKYATENQD